MIPNDLELKPCPFCHITKEQIEQKQKKYPCDNWSWDLFKLDLNKFLGNILVWNIECNNCGIMVVFPYSGNSGMVDVIEIWNAHKGVIHDPQQL